MISLQRSRARQSLQICRVVSCALALSLSAPLASAEEAEALDDAVCLACHAESGQTYDTTVHARAIGPGCQTCHGDGQEHVNAGGGKGIGTRSFAWSADADAQTLQDDDATCLSCHEGRGRAHWNGSSHDMADVSCAACHQVMKQVSPHGLLSAETETETCSACHLLPRAQTARNSHMPVREGKMSCSSCHNPHGTVSDSLIDAPSVNDSCWECHAETRGPFLYEHPPVVENCLSCHLPHGSTRKAMLKLEAPRLCQECHGNGHASNPRSANDKYVVGSSCMNCHPSVHGTNHPSGRAFR